MVSGLGWLDWSVFFGSTQYCSAVCRIIMGHLFVLGAAWCRADFCPPNLSMFLLMQSQERGMATTGGEWARGRSQNKTNGCFFAIFYIDDAYLASRDPKFLQRALNVLVNLFSRVGLETNVKKNQTMIFRTERIRTQLRTASYQQMKGGLTTAGEWDSWKVQCHQCNKMMSASSLCRHLADQHKVYQQVVVVEELLGERVGVTYQVHPDLGGGLKCPIPRCAGDLRRGWLLWQHFRDLHPLNKVVVLTEGCLLRCERCAMQVNPAYPQHIRTKECQTGVERKLQQIRRFVWH